MSSCGQVVASPPRWRGPQVRAPRPVARAAVGTQECTQIGENGLSAQPPLACGVRPLVRTARKVRFSVTSRWRRPHRMRFSVECAFPHLRKRGATSRKGALCTPDLTEKRTLCPAHTQNALFRDVEVARPPRLRFSVRVTLPECAFP